MTPIHFVFTTITGNEKVKRDAAIRQTLDLIDRIDGGKKYRLLTQEDRALLKQEGYAQDLLNNIIFLTQRITDDKSKAHQYDDRCLTGFTFSAFDPSIYASSTIRNNLIRLSQGCCMYCESPLYATGGACVSHYRPPSTISNGTSTLRSPYYSLAYQQDNLLYSCHECSAVYKRDQFPVRGHRFPLTALENEQCLLLHPYKDNTREHIRFNPLTAKAYSFDAVVDFYRSWKNLSCDETSQLLYQKPHYIPSQKNAAGEKVSDDFVDDAFKQWQRQNEGKQYRGTVTINTLGLNRAGLVYTRHKFLRHLYEDFLLDPGMDKNTLDKEYKSLAIDAINTWQAEKKQDDIICLKASLHDKNDQFSSGETVPSTPWQTLYQKPLRIPIAEQKYYIPAWMASSLMYISYHKHGEMMWPRRLVFLNSDDAFYGRDTDKKCIFTSINWEKEFYQRILVKSPRHTWSASFQEIAESHQSEIIKLFSENELWVLND